MLISLAIEQAELEVDVGAGGNDRSGSEQMAQSATEIALAFEQRGQPHVRFEIAGLAADQLAIDVERLERILVGDAARFFETLAHAGGTETVFDLAALIVAGEVENQLAGLGLDQRRTVAHDDAAVVVDEFRDVTDRSGSTSVRTRSRVRWIGSICWRVPSSSLAMRISSRSLNAK